MIRIMFLNPFWGLDEKERKPHHNEKKTRQQREAAARSPSPDCGISTTASPTSQQDTTTAVAAAGSEPPAIQIVRNIASFLEGETAADQDVTGTVLESLCEEDQQTVFDSIADGVGLGDHFCWDDDTSCASSVLNHTSQYRIYKTLAASAVEPPGKDAASAANANVCIDTSYVQEEELRQEYKAQERLAAAVFSSPRSLRRVFHSEAGSTVVESRKKNKQPKSSRTTMKDEFPEEAKSIMSFDTTIQEEPSLLQIPLLQGVLHVLLRDILHLTHEEDANVGHKEEGEEEEDARSLAVVSQLTREHDDEDSTAQVKPSRSTSPDGSAARSRSSAPRRRRRFRSRLLKPFPLSGGLEPIMGDSENDDDQTSHYGAVSCDEEDDQDYTASMITDLVVKDHSGIQPLVRWNVDTLAKCLERIQVRRKAVNEERGITTSIQFDDHYHSEHGMASFLEDESVCAGHSSKGGGGTVLDEVKDVIVLPRFPMAALQEASAHGFENAGAGILLLDSDVRDQLEEFVATVASIYGDKRAFHNYAQATHVTRSMAGFFTHAVTSGAAGICPKKSKKKKKKQHQRVDQGGGPLLSDALNILSDPLIQFACLFAALVHSMGHPGVPNATLVKENVPIASVYGYRSIAQQNSFDIAWGLLMGPEYLALRSAICSDKREMETFRQVVVNAVLATDLSDRDANLLRRMRWDKAFQSCTNGGAVSSFSVDRMATIVMEHLMQASAVIHTMQDWQTYCRWSECLFEEVYSNYLDGRVDKNPTLDWYKEELALFDMCVIPLAKRLVACGAFGTLADDHLRNATENRDRWAARGRERIQQMLAKLAQQVEELNPF